MRREASLCRPRSDTMTSGGLRLGPLALLPRPGAGESSADGFCGGDCMEGLELVVRWVKHTRAGREAQRELV